MVLVNKWYGKVGMTLIAKRLNSDPERSRTFTRNAVAGMAYRLGLMGRERPISLRLTS